MTHVLICGMTLSGKTSLAKKLIRDFYTPNGNGSIVLDPNLDPSWGASYMTDSPHEFLNVMKKNRSCALFVDESGESIGSHAKEMMIVTTKSRHFGHKAHLLCQRAQQIDRNVRDQCSEIYLFAVSPYDAQIFAQENKWGNILLKASELEQGECIHFGRFKKPTFMNTFTGQIYNS